MECYTNLCVDCGKHISLVATRCKSCANKNRTGRFKWPEEAKRRRMGKGNPMWKGDKVGYKSLHIWIAKRKPKPALCEQCGKVPPMELANISGQYKRDVNDYRWVCRRCHMESDGRLAKFINRNRGV